MLLRLCNHKGQNTAEYAIVIALIIGAVIAMQTYVKRGLQGRMKDATDYTATQTSDIGSTKQYEPYYLDSTFDTAQKSTADKETLKGGSVTSKTTGDTSRVGYQQYEDTSGQD
jgi:Flp pilus assembly pilin Flp